MRRVAFVVVDKWNDADGKKWREILRRIIDLYIFNIFNVFTTTSKYQFAFSLSQRVIYYQRTLSKQFEAPGLWTGVNLGRLVESTTT